jgi:hypothetical protein
VKRQLVSTQHVIRLEGTERFCTPKRVGFTQVLVDTVHVEIRWVSAPRVASALRVSGHPASGGDHRYGQLMPMSSMPAWIRAAVRELVAEAARTIDGTLVGTLD